MALQLIAASDTGSGNLLVGLVLGLCIGLLVGPAFRSWLVLREWSRASREAKLADRLVTKLEADAVQDVAPADVTGDASRPPGRLRPRTGATWPTPR